MSGVSSFPGIYDPLDGMHMPRLRDGVRGLQQLVRAPRKAFFLKDDFFTGGVTSGTVGELGWGFTNFACTLPTQIAGYPGIVQLAQSAVATTINSLWLRTGTNTAIVFPADYFDMRWIVKFDNGGAGDRDIRYGMMADTAGNPSTDGIYIECLNTDSNFFGVCRSGGSETRVDTGVAYAQTWFNFRMWRYDAGQIAFSVNDQVPPKLVASNVPTAGLQVGWSQVSVIAAARRTFLDYWDLVIGELAR